MKLVHKDIEKNASGLVNYLYFYYYINGITPLQTSGVDSGRIRGYVAPVQSRFIRR